MLWAPCGAAEGVESDCGHDWLCQGSRSGRPAPAAPVGRQGVGVGATWSPPNRDLAISKGCFQRLKSSSRSASLNPCLRHGRPGSRLERMHCPALPTPPPSPPDQFPCLQVNTGTSGSPGTPAQALERKSRAPIHTLGRAARPHQPGFYLHCLGQKPGSLMQWMRKGQGAPDSQAQGVSPGVRVSQLKTAGSLGLAAGATPAATCLPPQVLCTSEAPPPRRLPKCNRRLWVAAAPLQLLLL